MLNNLSNSHASEDSLQISLKSQKKPSRRAKTGLSLSNSKSKLSKPQLSEIINESPYAQIQSLSKNRSNSSIKLKVPSKVQPIHLNSSISTALLTKPKSSSTASHSFQPSENSFQIKQRLLANTLVNGGTSKNSAKMIEDRISESLKRMKDKQMVSARFEVFRTAFDEIIEQDENFGWLLRKVKEAYEQRIRTECGDVNKDSVVKLKEELRELREKMLTAKDEKKLLVKKIEKLAKENGELSRHLDDRESRYVDLQDKMMKLTKVDLDEVPKDDNSWKYIVSENQHLLKICEEMRKDIKHLSRKEKKLVKLVVALKNRGFPVEDVYQEDVHKVRIKKPLTCDEPVIDDSENEDLISGRPQPVSKPTFIPSLKLDVLEPTPDSSSDSSASSSDSDA
jgi:hypothetical protein